MGVDDAIVMDQRTFKSLASESRVKMLKLLGGRRHTLSEIAAALGISLANASEHLGKLEESNLVRQIDEGRKWKYYELTKDGRAIVASSQSPYPRSFVILLAISMIGVLASLMLFSGIADSAFGGSMAAPQAKGMQEAAKLAKDEAPKAVHTGDEGAAGAGGNGSERSEAAPLAAGAAPANFTGEKANGSAGAEMVKGESDVGGAGEGAKREGEKALGLDKILEIVFAIVFGASALYCVYRLAKARREKRLIE